MAMDSSMKTFTQLHRAHVYYWFSHNSFALQEHKLAVDCLVEASAQRQNAHL